MDNFSRKANYEKVRYDLAAVKFHADKYLAGAVYPLAKQCYQLTQYLANRSVYQLYLDQLEEELGTSNTKP
jgi:hypothetical protein